MQSYSRSRSGVVKLGMIVVIKYFADEVVFSAPSVARSRAFAQLRIRKFDRLAILDYLPTSAAGKDACVV